ncbi:dipeptide ABC transporter ATP-binding protein [Microbacterium sp. NPDC087591]|uniref:dipeptide ABC transporter ATP-binding protein n=1 Tax=Microbacterium sp. NPDC087591 TaxID=3364192 RepID=UPI0037F698E1
MSADRPVLTVRDLTVRFQVDKGRQADVAAVTRLSYEVGAGEILAIVGESGSGKSVSSMALMGLLPDTATVTGSARMGDTELLGLSRTALSDIRGKRISMVFQDAIGALDPVFTVGFQLREVLARHRPDLDRAQRDARAIELLRLVDLPDPEARMRFYPHQFSGGQCQRVMIAMALACDPELLIADEPTTALDVTVQAEVLDVLRRLRDRTSAAIILITHDMGVVADLADRVVVMRHGEAVESAEVHQLFAAPEAAYTQQLLSAVPRIGAPARLSSSQPGAVLEVDDLVVEYSSRRRTVRAVDGVSLQIAPGELLALVGESGSGKSTLGRAALGLAPITSGAIRINGVDVASGSRAAQRDVRRRVGVVFQNPLGSMNPRYTVAESVGEPLAVHAGLRGEKLHARVTELLESVELPGAWTERYPHELSGGQRQRVAIARAIALQPDLLIADEPTSALDVSVQATVLELFRRLQQEFRFACLFVSHDLAVVDELADRVAVMHHGRLAEIGDRLQVLQAPRDAYTRTLLDAAPVPDPQVQRARRAS